MRFHTFSFKVPKVFEEIRYWRFVKPFSHDQKKPIDSLRRILQARIVYLIIP